MRPLQILMVEDQSDDAELIRLSLEQAGLEVSISRVDDVAALREALTRPVDVVLTDCSMPQLRARVVIETVKGADRWTPVIVVSGSIGEVEAVELLKAGAGDFVSKLNLARLEPAIRRELADAQIRRERAEALAALQEAVRARDEFLTIAAHELKTPVTALKLQLAMLRKLDLSPVASARVEAADRTAERIHRMISRLLDISDFVGRAPELSREELTLARLLGERLAAAEREASRAGSRLALEADPEVRVHADERWLSVAFENLLQNAIKFGEGKPVTVRARKQSGRAVVEVEDHGRGIRAEDQQRIFERFERAVPTEHYGGFGLGLWIARQVVELHGGSLRVRSAPAAGACFTVELPAQE